MSTVDGFLHGDKQAMISPVFPTNSVLDYVYLLSLCPNGLVWHRSREGYITRDPGAARHAHPEDSSLLSDFLKTKTVTMETPMSPAVIVTLTQSKGKG